VSLLEVRNLRVSFATPHGSVQAVENFGVSIDAGETVALVGESGSGKSVSALAIARLLPTPPSRIETGEVLFEGRDLLALGERELRRVRGKELGLVFQDPTSSLHPLMTIGEQLEEALLVHERMPRASARQRAEWALAEVGIADPRARLSAFPHQLSGGMRQRALIAMALLTRPKLLIADEPTTALDVTIQASLFALLRKVQREHGTALLLITHDLALVSTFARRTLVMYAGAVVESGLTSELVARPAHPYTRALLRSVPSLSTSLDHALPVIPGAPPDPSHPALGCAFAPRCEFALSACHQRRPALVALSTSASGEAGVRVHSRRVACTESERTLAAEVNS